MTASDVERENYILLVMECIPPDVPGRDEIERDIRAVIAGRQEAGEALRDILDDLGRPLELAESYLEDEPMENGGVRRRFVAKAIDTAIPYAILIVAAVRVGISQLTGGLAMADYLLWVVFGVLFVCMPIYTEWRWGQTPGKYLMGLRVVRTSGARISFGQAAMRQIPTWFQFFFIDALFALFTPLKQRAFEKLSETRTIRSRGF